MIAGRASVGRADRRNEHPDDRWLGEPFSAIGPLQRSVAVRLRTAFVRTGRT